jgi:hypothetical protein
MDTVKRALDELKKLLEPEAQDDPKGADLPELGEALYVEPAPGGEHRNCSNCILWQPLLTQCSIHETSVEVTEFHVCGYHVFGSPSKQWKDLKGLQPVNPKFSGLVLAKGGTACENCNHWTPMEDDDGICAAVMKRGKPAHTASKGCCARWVIKQTPTDPKVKAPT